MSCPSYIKPQLGCWQRKAKRRCMSCPSYIKPQPKVKSTSSSCRCMSCPSYIKPQLTWWEHLMNLVVCLVLPTSNHNWPEHAAKSYALYVLSFLHQTTTAEHTNQNTPCCMSCPSYIKPQLAWECYKWWPRCMSCPSYIKPQLLGNSYRLSLCCMSCPSYIKPQLEEQFYLPSIRCMSCPSYIKPQPLLFNTT